MGNANVNMNAMAKGPGRICCRSKPLPVEEDPTISKASLSAKTLQFESHHESIPIPVSVQEEEEPPPPPPEEPPPPPFPEEPVVPDPSNVNSVASDVTVISWHKTLAQLLQYPPMTPGDALHCWQLWALVSQRGGMPHGVWRGAS